MPLRLLHLSDFLCQPSTPLSPALGSPIMSDLPVSQIVPHHEPMAEHYLYLPSVGFCLVVALGWAKVFTSTRMRPYACAALGIVLLLLSLRTVVRNADWYDDLTLWEKTVRTAPQSFRAHMNLGFAYFQREAWPRALGAYEAALRILPNQARTHEAMGSAYMRQGQLDKARVVYRQAIALQPDWAQAHANLARVLRRQGWLDAARQAWQQALAVEPYHAQWHYEFGLLYEQQGVEEKAREQFLQTLDMAPDHVQAHWKLGMIDDAKGDLNRAIAAYQAVLRLQPGHAESHLRLAMIYMRAGRHLPRARQHLQQFLVLAPQHPQAPSVQQLIRTLAMWTGVSP